jgi:lysophospholipase L1-like esterase
VTTLRLCLLVAAALGCAAPLTAADPFAFRDGDRVVLIGSTLIERAQKYGYWELALTLKNKDKNVTFRNLGWSGDTVFGESRNSFDPSPKGFQRLVSLTKELKPTVIVICYGHNESFAGPSGVAKFTAGLEKLIDALKDTKARVVLMSPTPFENAGPVKDADAKNKNLALYRDALRAVAQKRGLEFVDVFEAVRLSDIVRDCAGPDRRTENGMHLTPDGYRVTAEVVAGTRLPVDEPLRAKIIEKNRLFFYRWRPQNQTYLFGFRKHEQGQNAKEVAQFDPLVAAAEKEIAELKAKLK